MDQILTTVDLETVAVDLDRVPAVTLTADQPNLSWGAAVIDTGAVAPLPLASGTAEAAAVVVVAMVDHVEEEGTVLAQAAAPLGRTEAPSQHPVLPLHLAVEVEVEVTAQAVEGMAVAPLVEIQATAPVRLEA